MESVSIYGYSKVDVVQLSYGEVQLGYDEVQLGYDEVQLGYDVVQLGYDEISVITNILYTDRFPFLVRHLFITNIFVTCYSSFSTLVKYVFTLELYPASTGYICMRNRVRDVM